MRYIGSKASTVESIADLITPNIPSGTFCDPFGGIGTVGSHFLSIGYDVWSGDILRFPHYFQIARIRFDSSNFAKLLDHLNLGSISELTSFINEVTPTDGWFTREYSEKRDFFLYKNARRIQGIKEKILSWSQKRLLNYEEKAILLASLVDCMDRVANTAGTYYAHLKEFTRKSLNDFRFEFIRPASYNRKGNCFHGQAADLVKKQHFNILYLDPPYNQRSYRHYYHLPRMISNQEEPSVHGKSGIPIGLKNNSGFNSPRLAESHLKSLLESSSFDMLLFHYTDEGIISPNSIINILSGYGEIENYYIECKKYSVHKSRDKVTHHIYIINNA